jgi:hypothetical protein
MPQGMPFFCDLRASSEKNNILMPASACEQTSTPPQKRQNCTSNPLNLETEKKEQVTRVAFISFALPNIYY